jgi:hypothetical protein
LTTPAITKFTSLGNIFVQTYERYLPSAFDESLSLLQKVNKVISYLNQNSQLMDSVLDQWNEIYDWVTTDGLDDAVAVQLNLNYALSGEIRSVNCR